MTTDNEPPQKLGGYDFLRHLGSPKYGVAPMVDASELPFRMLCRKYGADIAWSPMIHSRLFVESPKLRKKFFTTCPEDRPLAIQFCANDPDTLLAAAKLVEDQCDAIDLNFGCPQNIAKRGNYGAFLCEKWDLIRALVSILHKNLKIPVFCKMRILDSHERTIEYAKMFEDAGCQLLTVHGRTKEQRGQNQGLANWDIIRDIKNTLKIPVFANGNIRDLNDVQRCLEYTGCDGVMSACGLLGNPALFSGLQIPPCNLALEYLDFSVQYPVDFNIIRGHLFKILQSTLANHTDLREALNVMKNPNEMRALVLEIYTRENGGVPTELALPPKKQPRNEESVFDTENEEDSDVCSALFN